MALDVTVGGASANSFASVDEFKTYRTNRLPAVASVLASTDGEIEIALIVGCRFLNQDFTWTGSAVDAVQALTWPRRGMLTRNGFSIPTTVNPAELKTAQCEIAYELLAGVNLIADNDALLQGISSVQAGSVSVSFQRTDINTEEGLDMFMRRMNSEFNYLSDQIKSEVRHILVPSWFEQPSIKRPVLFAAFGGGAR